MNEANQNAVEDFFVSLVFNKPCIWQRGHANYRNNAAKEAAWFSIAQQVNLDATAAKEKFRLMRQKYVREKVKIANAARNGAKLYNTKPWHLMKTLQFLDEVIKSKKAVSTMRMTLQQTNCYSSNATKNNSDETKQELTMDMNDSSSYSVFSTSPEPYSTSTPRVSCDIEFVNVPSSSETQSHTPELSSNANILESVSHKQKIVHTQPAVSAWGEGCSNRTKYFCQYIASRLEEIPLSRRTAVEMDIFNVINKHSQ